MSLVPRTLLVGLALVLALPATAGIPDEVLTVTRKETKLRSGKRLYAPGVCDLKEGDVVTANRREGAWWNVSFKTFTGWIHESDVTDKKDVRLSGEGVRENYSATETAAARKGFNREIEGEYTRNRPAMAEFFRVVDQIQSRGLPESEIERFLRDGRLIKE